MGGLKNILLPDWVARRQEAEQVEHFLDHAAEQARQEKRHEEKISGFSFHAILNENKHRANMKAKRRARNRVARISRRRNRARH